MLGLAFECFVSFLYTIALCLSCMSVCLSLFLSLSLSSPSVLTFRRFYLFGLSSLNPNAAVRVFGSSWSYLFTFVRIVPVSLGL